MFFNFLPASLQYLFASYLLSNPRPADPDLPLTFSLRHELGLSNSSRTVFTNVPPSSQLSASRLTLGATSLKTHKPQSQAAFSSARFGGANAQQELRWEEANILGPNVHRRENLHQLAKMANNAYSEGQGTEWYDIGLDWNNVSRHGLRGFAV